MRPQLVNHCVALCLLLASVGAYAACDEPSAKFVSVTGVIEVQPDSATTWAPASLATKLCKGDTIRVGERSRAAVALANDAVLRLDEKTTMRLVDIAGAPEETSFLDMLRGALQSFSRKPNLLEVSTPYLNGSIEGTEFLVRVGADASAITVLEGVVIAANDHGRVALQPGESADATAGRAPQKRTLVRPRDEAQWSLYYPPILSSTALTSAAPAVLAAARCAENGDTVCAFKALDGVPLADQGSEFLVLRASLFLAVGRVDEARGDIDRALNLDAGESRAYALRSVIRVVQNDDEGALADARRATELEPGSLPANIALSYALQSVFQIVEARDVMRAAFASNAGDALALARLAELELMLGNRASALDLAQQSSAIAPGLSRTELVLGFSALSLFRNTDAKAAFDRAIVADSADPLAHLGIGLARISDGELEAGRRDLEAAVALDASSALLRAYLGKSYFEERRYPLDSQQYEIAAQLDPNDPTAYLYNGILKQSVNRPVEALADLERTVELNDNRAVYRGRLLLDEDRAARGTSLARAFKDLGFRRLGINESSRSLGIDPSNSSAHRFLADTYLGARRSEISRVSETLQAQMLQDVNINPVQPSLVATNLNIITLGGAAQPGFNEFTPLFQRNKVQLNASAFGGNNDTYGAETVLSGVYDRFSFSGGAYSYDTDGWRANNDVDANLYNGFVQWAATEKLNIQAEFQRKRTTEGDLAFNFDRDAFLADKETHIEQDTWRAGLRFEPISALDLLVSYVHNQRDDTRELSEPLDQFTTSFFDNVLDETGDQVEAQFIYRADIFNVTGGAAFTYADVGEAISVSFVDVVFGPLFAFSENNMFDRRSKKGYLYFNVQTGDNLDWTIGASYDDYEDEAFAEETSFNPKFGLRWRTPIDGLTLRAAVFKVLKPALIDNRTLEPTQVAGFNQFFDDINATRSWRYGVGLDWRATQSIAVGAQATWRDLDEPVLVFDPVTGGFDRQNEDRDEQLHSAYLYWTLCDQLAVNATVNYDVFDSEKGELTNFGNLPERVRTVSTPIAVNYFSPMGYYASIGSAYVDQKVDRSAFSTQGRGSDNFFVVDASLGYRLPKRRGTISVGVKNLFDAEFEYQDDSYRETSVEASTGPYFPSRVVLATLTLSF